MQFLIYKLIEVWEGLFFSISFKKWMKLQICDEALKTDLKLYFIVLLPRWPTINVVQYILAIRA